jgi:small conductance mechanosensitive channel
MSKEYAHAVIEVSVPYRENVDEAFDIMRAVGRELRNAPEQRAKILGDLEIDGIERWEQSAVVLRGRFKVAPMFQWEVRREFLRRLRRALDQRRSETTQSA